MLKLLERFAIYLAGMAWCIVATVWDIDFVISTLKFLAGIVLIVFTAYELYDAYWMHHAMPKFIETVRHWLN